jgi:hypothetical protein
MDFVWTKVEDENAEEFSEEVEIGDQVFEVMSRLWKEAKIWKGNFIFGTISSVVFTSEKKEILKDDIEVRINDILVCFSSK